MADLTIKRGDTFIYTAQWAGVSLSDLRSQVRDSLGRLVSEVSISETDDADIFLLTVSDTSEWPVGTLFTDIQCIVGEITLSSVTMTINVARDVTQ
ncbi:hypothetical protein [Paenibacillus wynnii]|uniref:Uncharacterized protein n=1 Tax=Paenibacillus wynnii TaxID=268407 RepID=A0A098MEW6_9BACL|nr:hypothetical protein [Paenibacillus wynnii]KGE16233.1 hypothetical protein PWYN_15840 [Paenibacillus wynnii]KGE21105.1 hypothetical protein PWYN_02930 [Paenibacillus wynnii]